MAHEYLAEGANNRPSSDEDDGETHHEKDCAHHSTCPTLSFNDVCGPQACHIAEIAGMRGKTQGEKKDNKPANTATGIAPAIDPVSAPAAHDPGRAASLALLGNIINRLDQGGGTHLSHESGGRAALAIDDEGGRNRFGSNSVNLNSNAPSGS